MVPFIDQDNTDSQLPALPTTPPCPPLVPERSDFLEGNAPAAHKVQAFLANALEASDGSATVAGPLVPWICDALLSNHSVKAYGRDFMDFVRHMQAQGVTRWKSPPTTSSSTIAACSRPVWRQPRSPDACPCSAALTSSSRPRGSFPGR